MNRTTQRYIKQLEKVLDTARETVNPVPSIRALSWLERRLNVLSNRVCRAEKLRKEFYER